LTPTLLALAVVLCWVFPRFWYSSPDPQRGLFWLAEQEEIPGWTFREMPVSESAERALVADRLVAGEFTRTNGSPVRVFSAKRYVEKENEIGLFVHTPDRCWTEAGWKLEVSQPEVVQLKVQGLAMCFERRIFTAGNQRELVYFGGIVGGQPLPFRLDHNLSVGVRYSLRRSADRTGTTLRASDAKLWTRTWDSFRSRSPLMGPKQFIRVSTPIHGNDLWLADRTLEDFLGRWLRLSDYQTELASWKSRPSGGRGSAGRESVEP
jgi:hypothetical protein